MRLIRLQDMAIELEDKDRVTLLKWVRSEAGEVRKARRAGIVLALSEGKAVRAVGRELGVDENTVRLWRDRYLRGGVEALAVDAPRPGRPATIPSERKRAVVTLACQTKPENATHWNTREMAKVAGVSQSSVQRIWSSNGIKPHLVRTFKLSSDPRFEEKLLDVVGLYLDPPEKALVLCVDEKSQIQALDRTQPGLPMKKGRCGTMTHDYKRHGTTTLFAALNVLDGTVIGSCKKQHRHEEFLAFLKEVDKKTPKGLDLHLVLDNYGTHKHPNVKAWLAEHERFFLHFVPTSCSWLNLVERFFAEITNKAIRRGAFDSVAELEDAIKDYLQLHNRDAKPFRWTASAESIIDKVNRCREINDSEQ
jgi:transposase